MVFYSKVFLFYEKWICVCIFIEFYLSFSIVGFGIDVFEFRVVIRTKVLM